MTAPGTVFATLNPATGETIKIPKKTVAKFRIAKVCKESILN